MGHGLACSSLPPRDCRVAFRRSMEVSRVSGGPRVFVTRAMEKADARSVPVASGKVRVPHVLTVAGSDSGAGAGIQADLKACAASGVYCSTVITAITAQNTLGVQGVSIVADDVFGQQLKSVLDDMRPDVVKTGMLPSPSIVKVLCENLKDYRAGALVVDPVMVSTSGDVLAGPRMLASFRGELLPMADIVTPNLKEASALLGGVPIETVADMHHAAKSIQEFGPRNVLVKGGDLPDSIDAVDVLYDGKDFFEFRSRWVKTRNTHGTGCSLASFIAAELAKGSSMFSAVKVAKRYIETALEYSRDIHILIGEGHQGPFDHLMKLKNNSMDIRPRKLFERSDLLFYAVTDSRMNEKWGRSIGDAVEAAINGGATIVLLREKDADTKDFLEAAKTCLGICRRHGVPFLINDRIDIAIACDADGVHLGQSDMPPHIARSVLGPDKIIGVSCKTPEQADKAWCEGADYISCGGVYPTNTKENNVTVGLEGLERVCLSSKLPVVAIGGIGISNARAVMELDVPSLEGVAVVSAIFDRESVFAEAQVLRKLIINSRKVAKKDSSD